MFRVPEAFPVYPVLGSVLRMKAITYSCVAEENEKGISPSPWGSEKRQQERGDRPGKRFAIAECSIALLGAVALYGAPLRQTPGRLRR